MEVVIEAEASAPAAPSLLVIFRCFLKLGAVAFGGVYGMLSLLERELVVRRGWITSEALAECVALGQVTPGPPIVNIGVLVGYRLRGVPGAVAATVGQILPGFLVVLLAGAAYVELRASPLLRGALRGVGAAVVGLLASVVVSLGRRAVTGARTAAVAAAAFALLAFARASPAVLLAGAALAGILACRGRP